MVAPDHMKLIRKLKKWGPYSPSINVRDWEDCQNLLMEHFSFNRWARVIDGSLGAMQAMHYPHLILKEMLRNGKECIITVPNFVGWKIRYDLAVN